MEWEVIFCEPFEREFEELGKSVQDELLSHALLLERFGPLLGRPTVDTLKGSSYFNMKEMRFSVDKGVWRVAFAFDPERCAILLMAANKRGVNQKRFYKDLINIADERFDLHLESLKEDTVYE